VYSRDTGRGNSREGGGVGFGLAGRKPERQRGGHASHLSSHHLPDVGLEQLSLHPQQQPAACQGEVKGEDAAAGFNRSSQFARLPACCVRAVTIAR